MSSPAREAAKFLSGIAAHETVGHWWLGIWGTSMLPWKIGGFEFTAGMNMWCMAAWPIIMVALVYFAWVRKARAPTPIPPGTARLA